jgi:quercetin dioxygenase-like cupin family protein
MTLGDRDYYIGPNESLWEKAPIPGVVMSLLVGFKQSLGAYSLVKYESAEPNAPHTHAYDDESVYLIEGELTVEVGDKTYDVEPGGFLYMPRLVQHAFIPRTKVVGLSIQTPGGVFDTLHEEIGSYLNEGKELSNEKYVELQLKHGIHAPDGWTALPDQPD